MLDDRVAELRALDLDGVVHQAGEVVGYRLGRDRAFRWWLEKGTDFRN